MNPPRVRLTLTGPQSVRVGGAILIELTLTNDGPQPVLVNGRFAVAERADVEGQFEVSFDVRGADGATLSFLVDVDGFDPTPADLVALPPAGEHTGSVRLDRYFLIQGAGDYRVGATYHSAVPLERDGQRAFVGTLVAEPITITVAR